MLEGGSLILPRQRGHTLAAGLGREPLCPSKVSNVPIESGVTASMASSSEEKCSGPQHSHGLPAAKRPGLPQANTKNGRSFPQKGSDIPCLGVLYLFSCFSRENQYPFGNWILVPSRPPLTSINAAIVSTCHMYLRFQTCLQDTLEVRILLCKEPQDKELNCWGVGEGDEQACFKGYCTSRDIRITPEP